MKSILFSLVLTAIANAKSTDLNPLLQKASPYLKINSAGDILKPDSSINFKKTSDGWSSDYDSLSSFKKGKSKFYLALSKQEFGNGTLFETNGSSITAMTNCSGNFKPHNKVGIKCSTLSLDTCTSLFRNFSDLSNPAMSNPVVRSAFKNATNSTDGSFIEEFKMNLRQCSDAFMLVNNMEGSKEGFKLKKDHALTLKSKIESFPVSSVSDSWNNQQAHSLNQGMLSVINKAEIFTKCGELMRHDQMTNNRKTFLPLEPKDPDPNAEQESDKAIR